jgi:NADPH:quinone reductase-like Zn-dependent oxidoreductase
LIPDGKKAPNPPDAADYASETLPELMRLLAQGHIHPVVADRFPLLEARRAHERMEEGGYEGKIVLIPTVQDPQQPHREHP